MLAHIAWFILGIIVGQVFLLGILLYIYDKEDKQDGRIHKQSKDNSDKGEQ